MTRADLKTIRENCAATTGKSWAFTYDSAKCLWKSDFGLVATTLENLRFLRSARDDIPRLLNEISSLRAKLAQQTAINKHLEQELAIRPER